MKTVEPGTLFFVNDFCEFDNAYVSKILSLMASYNVLERLAKGIYDAAPITFDELKKRIKELEKKFKNGE